MWFERIEFSRPSRMRNGFTDIPVTSADSSTDAIWLEKNSPSRMAPDRTSLSEQLNETYSFINSFSTSFLCIYVEWCVKFVCVCETHIHINIKWATKSLDISVIIQSFYSSIFSIIRYRSMRELWLHFFIAMTLKIKYITTMYINSDHYMDFPAFKLTDFW